MKYLCMLAHQMQINIRYFMYTIKNNKNIHMKTLFKYMLIGLLFTQTKSVKAIEKGDFNIYLTTNLGHHTYIPVYSLKGIGFIPGFTFNMDYAASPYFGIGGWFTFSGRTYGADLHKYRSMGLGMRGVFHLYQLASEKGNAKLDADKFDLYIPLALGGGFRLPDKTSTTPGFNKFRGGAIVGGGLGLSYYFVEHIGVNAEAGYLEGSYAKVGLVFKF